MGTHYKPSQWRGRRRIYRSIDPDEPTRETVRRIRFVVVGGVVALMALWLLSR